MKFSLSPGLYFSADRLAHIQQSSTLSPIANAGSGGRGAEDDKVGLVYKVLILTWVET